jgi:hypothetical protein
MSYSDDHADLEAAATLVSNVADRNSGIRADLRVLAAFAAAVQEIHLADRYLSVSSSPDQAAGDSKK